MRSAPVDRNFRGLLIFVRSNTSRCSRSATLVLFALLIATCVPATADAASVPGLLTQLPGASGCVAQAVNPTCVNDARGLDGINAVAVSPDGRNVYVAAGDSNAIAIFDRDATTGALAQKAGAEGCITNLAGDVTCNTGGRAISNVTNVIVSPDGKNVYATGRASNSIAIFDRDPSTGGLTQKAGAAGCITTVTGDVTCTTSGRALGGAYGATVSPDGGSVYVVSQSSDGVAVFDRNSVDGTLTQKAGAAGCVVQGTDATCANTGRALDDAWGVIVSPDGENAYVTASGSDGVAIFDRNPADGSLTQKAGTAGCIVMGTDVTCTNDGRALDFARGPAISPDGKSVYIASQQGGTVTVFDRDLDTGGLSQKAGAAGCITVSGALVTCNTTARGMAGAMSVEVSPDNRNVYVAAQNSDGVAVFDRDLLNGELTQKTGKPGCFIEGGDATCDNSGRGMPSAYWIALSPDGLNAYVGGANDAMAILKRDLPPTCQEVGGISIVFGQSAPVKLNCTDPNGDPLTYAIVTNPAHGGLTGFDATAGTAVYSPAASFVGADSFTFGAFAGSGESDPATLSLVVDPPVSPVVTKLQVSPKRFRASKRARVGFELNRAASVRLVIQRRITGRKSGRRCSTKRKTGKRCAVYKSIKGAVSVDGIGGANLLVLNTMPGGKKLTPGRYRLLATPSADGLTGKDVSASFTLVR